MILLDGCVGFLTYQRFSQDQDNYGCHYIDIL